jgi:hypothetical protein
LFLSKGESSLVKNVVIVDVKSWGRGQSYNPETGRKDILMFVEDSLGQKGIERLENTKLGSSSIASHLVVANDELRGEKRRTEIRSLLKKVDYSVRFRNVSRHTTGQLNK